MAINNWMNMQSLVQTNVKAPKQPQLKTQQKGDGFSKIFQQKTSDTNVEKPMTDRSQEAKKPKVEGEVDQKADEKGKLGKNPVKNKLKADKPIKDGDSENNVSILDADVELKQSLDVLLALMNNSESKDVLEGIELEGISAEEVELIIENVLSVVGEETKVDTETSKPVMEDVSKEPAKEGSEVDTKVLAEAIRTLKDLIDKPDVQKNEKLEKDDSAENVKLYPIPKEPKLQASLQEINQTQPNTNSETTGGETPKVVVETIQSVLNSSEGKQKQTIEPTVKENPLENVSKTEAALTENKVQPLSQFQQLMSKQPVGVLQPSQEMVVPKTPIMNQVFEMIKGPIKLSEAGTMVKMKLQPEELGNVQLKLSLQKGIVLAEIKVENEIVKATVESNLDQLKQSLTNKGYQVSQVSVAVDLGGKEHAQHEFGQQRHNQNQSQPGQSYYGIADDFDDDVIFEALHLKDKGIGNAIDYLG